MTADETIGATRFRSRDNQAGDRRHCYRSTTHEGEKRRCKPQAGLSRTESSGLRQAPQDLNPFLGRVSSDLVHADEDGRVLGWINRDHIAES
jgi:hypothetical protein